MATATKEAVKITSPDCPALPALLKQAFEGLRGSDGVGYIDFGTDGTTIKGVLCRGRLAVHFVPKTDASYNAPKGEKVERDWYRASILGAQDGRSLSIRLRGSQLVIKRSAIPMAWSSVRQLVTPA